MSWGHHLALLVATWCAGVAVVVIVAGWAGVLLALVATAGGAVARRMEVRRR